MGATIGVVGGLGPNGTIHYYRKLTERLRHIPHDEGRPGIILDHVWMDRFAPLFLSGLEAAAIAVLGESLDRLQRAGADVALIAAVTPHRFISALRRSTSVPVIDVVEATIGAVRRARHARVGLLGTRATLTHPFFRGGLERAGISVTIPDDGDVTYLDDVIYRPLAVGADGPGVSNRLEDIVRRMAEGAGLDAVVVASTELIARVEPVLPLIDPVECHVALAVNSVRWTIN